MKLYMDPTNLNYFEALASHTRLRVIQLLSEKDMDIKELAEALDVSSSIMTKHVRKLESAGLITSSNVSKDGNRHKVCSLLNMVAEVQPPFKDNRADGGRHFYETSIPVGVFTDIRASAPCGMADENRVLGCIDEPVYLLGSERASAQLLWMKQGYVEYLLPNYLTEHQWLSAVELSGEFGSEVAGFNDRWPSTIWLSLNGVRICSFTTPGDFGSVHGALTPAWWDKNQYGILVVITIDGNGVFVNGEKKAGLTVEDLPLLDDRWVLRLEVGGPDEKGGGMTLFGERFGNYQQSLLFRAYYT